jgi:hypothetical protein
VRWPWRRAHAGPVESRRLVSSYGKAMKLQAAMEILAEVFGARPDEVEEMIKRRQEESGPVEREKGRWTATFCLEE